MRILLAVVGMLLLPGAFAAEGSMLIYRQQETGIESYNTRILVTERYVRMDDDEDDGDYVLFDRKQGLISSVTHGDGTVLEIPARKVTQEPPMKLNRRSSEVQLENAPDVGKQAPHHYRLFVNDAACYNVVAVKGLLEETRQALIAFREVLSGEHAKLLPRLPADQQDPCDLARNTFHPAWQLEFGLPIQEWDEQGRGQLLLDYKERVELDDQLFTLPADYRHYTTDDVE